MIWGWMWIGIIVAAIAIEATTEQLVSIWFVPGAIIAAVLDAFAVDILIQALVFLVLSIVGIIFFRKMVMSKMDVKATKTNVDAIVGEKCIVTEKIDTFAGCGQVKVKGQVWSARGAVDEDVFEIGDTLQVIAIEGVKLICKKV